MALRQPDKTAPALEKGRIQSLPWWVNDALAVVVVASAFIAFLILAVG